MINEAVKCPAVLLIAFNRPDLVQMCLEAIAEAKPRRLYVAIDGPRPTHPDDSQLIEESRQVVTQGVHWPCEVFVRMRSENLGCRVGVVDALDWFFTREEEGIILEDDCIAHPEFFDFCAVLLERYRDNNRVLSIGGDNSGNVEFQGCWSYGFVRHPAVWGWATWRRAWMLYDRDMTKWREIRETPLVSVMFPDETEAMLRSDNFDSVLDGRIDTWDYQWSATCHTLDALTVMPAKNLISNVGFRADGTHTRKESSLASALTEPIFPLSHPPVLLIDRSAERQIVVAVDGAKPGITEWSAQRLRRLVAKMLLSVLNRTKSV